MRLIKLLLLTTSLCLVSLGAGAAEPVRLSLFSWPGYGFWFIAQEKNLAPDLDLQISII